jgi:hypothetical protein
MANRNPHATLAVLIFDAVLGIKRLTTDKKKPNFHSFPIPPFLLWTKKWSGIISKTPYCVTLHSVKTMTPKKLLPVFLTSVHP